MTTAHMTTAHMTTAQQCPVCPEPIELDQGRTLRLRHVAATDADGIEQLYHRLTPEDLLLRFFSAGRPPHRFFERWVALESRGGFGVVVELFDPGNTSDDGPEGNDAHIGPLIVAEAGYAPLDDGDVELGIAVDPAHRGWLGPWMLDALLVHAKARGIQNLQALVKSSNRSMLALARQRGFAVLDHPDWGTVRISMSTDGHTPSWPPLAARPRVLVAADRTRWSGEHLFRTAGFNLAICPAMGAPGRHCPELNGSSCPLVEGADAVVIDLDPKGPRSLELLDELRRRHPDKRIVSTRKPAAHGPTVHVPLAELLADLGDIG